MVAAELGVEDKVCESMEGMAPGNLREQGGTSPLRVSGLKGRGGSGEEGPRVGLSGEPLEGRRKGTRDLWQRQLKGPLGCHSSCVLFYF